MFLKAKHFFTVKITSDTKGFFRDLSREVAREARNINIMKKDTEKSHQRLETPRHTGEVEYTHTHTDTRTLFFN